MCSLQTNRVALTHPDRVTTLFAMFSKLVKLSAPAIALLFTVGLAACGDDDAGAEDLRTGPSGDASATADLSTTDH